MNFFLLVLQPIWFFFPAALANIAASVSKKIPFFNVPIDLNNTFQGQPLFGNHKTYRGMVFGVVVGIFTFYIQQVLYQYQFIQEISLFDYHNSTSAVGFGLGFGAIFGDLIKSFFKRRKGIASGRSWFPFDQTDWILGAALLTIPFVKFQVPVLFIIISIVLGFLFHLIFKRLGYWVGIENSAV
ncbi:MAG: CDP-archaeol synthase [Candidatus Pacebacteria bacterium]|nr:CDP-archaeol synthase [Candidatus Paceibacterota bacterium]